uniref:Putative secreted protein n=1 Tax=Amblyomma cajennense TaxID=34607 RepID=A0A023FB90_AMBCJ
MFPSLFAFFRFFSLHAFLVAVVVDTPLSRQMAPLATGSSCCSQWWKLTRKLPHTCNNCVPSTPLLFLSVPSQPQQFMFF